MQYHGERAGYHYFLPNRSDQVSYLLVPREVDHVAVPEHLLDGAEVLLQQAVGEGTSIKVMNRDGRAGFYIHKRGPLPYAIAPGPIDTFTLYRIYQPGKRDWLEQAYDSVPAGEILPQRPVSQEFTCSHDGLTRLRLLLATYNRRNDSSLVVSLYERTDDGGRRLAMRQVLDGLELADNAWRQIDFPPLASRGRTYLLELSSPDAATTSAVTIWTNANARETYSYGEEERNGALGLEVWCLPGTGDQE
jgi:hypothetical protein